MAHAVHKLATVADLFAIPEHQRFHEVISGEIIQRTNRDFRRIQKVRSLRLLP